MQVRRSMFAAAAIAVTIISVSRSASAQDDASSLRQIFGNYIQSVNTADVSLASQIWSQDADIIAVTPFGRFQGWDAVKTHVYINFLQTGFSRRHLEPSNVSTHVNGAVAWLVFDWVFTGTSVAGQSIESKGWESHVYQKTSSGWALVALHYSVSPP